MREGREGGRGGGREGEEKKRESVASNKMRKEDNKQRDGGIEKDLYVLILTGSFPERQTSTRLESENSKSSSA